MALGGVYKTKTVECTLLRIEELLSHWTSAAQAPVDLIWKTAEYENPSSGEPI
jgi:hypothetical protein